MRSVLVVGAPLDLVDGVVQRLVDALRNVAAAGRLERLQMAVNGVEVVGQVEHLGDVLVAAIAERDESDLQVRRRFAAGDLIADRPDLRLGPFDQAAHAAGGIEAEDDLDFRPLGHWLLIGSDRNGETDDGSDGSRQDGATRPQGRMRHDWFPHGIGRELWGDHNNQTS